MYHSYGYMECLHEMNEGFNAGRETIHLHVLNSFLSLYLPNNTFLLPLKKWENQKVHEFLRGN